MHYSNSSQATPRSPKRLRAVMAFSGLLLLLSGSLMYPHLIMAQEKKVHSCQMGKLERRVEIHYLRAGSKVPCEVRYFKKNETPTSVQTPWKADNQEGYCETKAGELVEKLSGWGWKCEIVGGN